MWKEGTLKVNGKTYRYWIKQYDTGSVYGIDGGRISKLMIKRGSKIVCNGSTAEWFKVCAEMRDKYFPTLLSWAKNCHDKWQAYIPAQCVEALGP